MPLAPSLDTPGLCARSSRDLALMLDVLAGHDANDPQTSRRSPACALAALESDETRPLTSLRIGVPRVYFREQVGADVSAALDASLERLCRSARWSSTQTCLTRRGS
jgi:aspartyl-tRNA(Asn)/glutamyl-tRNA(Gln) amidotransferase subunit A